MFGALEVTTGRWACRLGRRRAADFTAYLEEHSRLDVPPDGPGYSGAHGALAHAAAAAAGSNAVASSTIT